MASTIERFHKTHGTPLMISSPVRNVQFLTNPGEIINEIILHIHDNDCLVHDRFLHIHVITIIISYTHKKSVLSIGKDAARQEILTYSLR